MSILSGLGDFAGAVLTSISEASQYDQNIAKLDSLIHELRDNPTSFRRKRILADIKNVTQKMSDNEYRRLT